jgi:hypothetical protein
MWNFAYRTHFRENRVNSPRKIKIQNIEFTLKKANSDRHLENKQRFETGQIRKIYHSANRNFLQKSSTEVEIVKMNETFQLSSGKMPENENVHN